MAFERKISVGAHDIDINCNATPTAVIRFLQDTVDENMRICGPSYQQLMSEKKSFIVSRTALEVFRPLREYEPLTVYTWATSGRGVTFPRSFEIKSGEDTVLRCQMMWALIDLESRSFIKGSDFSVDSYGTGEIIELSTPTRFRLSPDTELNKVGEKRVMYSDIDKNRHMNNTRYFDMLFDYLPDREKLWMSSCQMNYISEAPYGETVDIYMSDAFTEGDERVYYFKTVVNGKDGITARMGVKYVDGKK